jgi:dTMP kinase
VPPRRPPGRAGHPRGRPGRSTVVVLGIDGAGKTTAASALVEAERSAGHRARLVRNPGGRRWLARTAERRGVRVPPAWADGFESAVRTLNVMVSHVRAALLPGTTVMDRHLVCQMVLRTARGLPPGRFLPWLSRKLLPADAVLLLDLPEQTAYARIAQRGEDMESLAYLRTAREAYLYLAAREGWRVVDAAAAPHDVLAQMRLALRSRRGG